MSSLASHPDSDTLLRLIDEDLPLAEALAISGHLLGCGDCRERLDAVRDVLDDYDRFHQEILKPSLPGPRRWGPLQFPETRRRNWRPAIWALTAAAAASAAIVILVTRAGHPPEVRAAELLRKAVIAEKATASSQRHVRIRTHGRTFDWPPRRNDRAALRAIFETAGYPSDNPLSAAAFSQWRDTLSQAHDAVQVTPASLIVRTSALAGAISDAALTLRSADLHAIACTLHFRGGGDEIEMAEVQEQPEPPAPPRADAPAIRPAAVASIADELHVITALHKIGADLGEPIEVDRTGPRVQVRVSGLDQTRRDQIREALAGLPAIELQFEQTPTSDAPAADQLTESTERAVDRAYALRALARRFPLEAEAKLRDDDVAALRAMVRDHAAALADAIHEMRRELALAASEPSADAAEWRSIAENAPNEAAQLDRLLNGATAARETRKPEIARVLDQLDRQARALRSIP